MAIKNKKWFDEQLRIIDPSEKIIKIDDNSDKPLIKYTSELNSDETHHREQKTEEYVHALFLCLMCSDKYGYNIKSFYHEKNVPKGSGGYDQLDYVINDTSGNAYAAVELKPYDNFVKKRETAIKDQLFALAPSIGKPSILIYATINPNGSTPQVVSEVIDFTKYNNYVDWTKAGEPSFKNTIPYKYQSPEFEPYIQKGKKDLKTDCTQADFRDVATKFHDEFFGEHPDNLLFINIEKCLLAKIYDERTGKDGCPYNFQIMGGKNEEDSQELFDRINELYKSAYIRYIDPNAANPDEINYKEFPKNKVKEVVRALQDMSITRGAALNSDVIGAFFEEILRVGFKQDKGMYFTHSNIARFMLEALDLENLTKEKFKNADHPNNRLPKIIDPACGSGTFLMNAMPIVTNAIRKAKNNLVNDDESRQFYNSNMSDENPNFWARDYLYGFDPKFIMAITAKINMVLHGDGSTHIYKYDAFSPFSKYDDSSLRIIGDDARNIKKLSYDKELCESFDVIASNPPFGITLSAETKKTLKDTFILSPTTSSECLFIERCFQLLKENGRLALVLPESVVNANDNENVRAFIYRMFKIKAIVSLPRNVFIDTPTLTSLLFAQKKTASEIEQWDYVWGEKFSEAEEKIKQARIIISPSLSSKYSSIKDIETAVLHTLSEVISDKDWIIKKGKNNKVLFMRLPSNITTVDKARSYYKEILSSTGLEKYKIRYAFEKTAYEFNYEFSTFQVNEVGYKLSKRKEKERDNQLCTFIGNKSTTRIHDLNLCSEPYHVKINCQSPETVLDIIRKEVIWEK